MNHVRGFFGILLLALTVLAVTAPVSEAEESGVPFPKLAKAVKGDKCVEPADDMRRNHMDYLKHQRDETMREGIRGNKYSFNACVDCHAVADPTIAGGRIRTLRPFCGSCHHYVSVQADCFSCHNPTAPLLKDSALDKENLSKMIASHLNETGGEK